MFLIMFVSGYS